MIDIILILIGMFTMWTFYKGETSYKDTYTICGAIALLICVIIFSIDLIKELK